MNFTAIGQSFLTNLLTGGRQHLTFYCIRKKTPSTSPAIKLNENNISVFRSKLLLLNLIASEVGSVQEFFSGFVGPWSSLMHLLILRCEKLYSVNLLHEILTRVILYFFMYNWCSYKYCMYFFQGCQAFH